MPRGYIIEYRFSYMQDGEEKWISWELQFNKHFYTKLSSAEEAIERFRNSMSNSQLKWEFRITPLYSRTSSTFDFDDLYQ